jgi:two-component sensor histidine kinase
LILNEALTNAFKYALPKSQTTPGLAIVIWQSDTKEPIFDLLIADSGPGLPLEQLPTKDSGFGSRMIYSLSRQLGGQVQWLTRSSQSEVFRQLAPELNFGLWVTNMRWQKTSLGGYTPPKLAPTT